MHLENATTNRTLWLLDAGDQMHLAFEPLRGVDPRSAGYLVLPHSTQLCMIRVQNGYEANVTCQIGTHTVMLDSNWLAHDIDVDDVDSQDITTDIITLEDQLVDCAIDEDWQGILPQLTTKDIFPLARK